MEKRGFSAYNRTTREGKRSFESTTRYRSSSTRQSGPRQFHRKVSKQWFSNRHFFHISLFRSTGDWKCRSFISQRWFSIVIANIKIFRQNDWNWKICFLTSVHYSIYFALDILYSSTYSYTLILIFKKVRLGLQISIDNKKKESKIVGIFFSPSLDESREERVEVIRQDK